MSCSVSLNLTLAFNTSLKNKGRLRKENLHKTWPLNCSALVLWVTIVSALQQRVSHYQDYLHWAVMKSSPKRLVEKTIMPHNKSLVSQMHENGCRQQGWLRTLKQPQCASTRGHLYAQKFIIFNALYFWWQAGTKYNIKLKNRKAIKQKHYNKL